MHMSVNHFVTFLFILVLLMYGCTQYSGSSLGYTSIKDLNQNPSTYVGQTVTISGMLNSRLGGHSLQDSEGYWIWIDDNCIEGQREYNLNSQFYTATGTWLAPEPDETGFGFGVKYKYRLSCTSPLA